MYDGRNNAGHGSPDHVGDVWNDDYANGTDSRCRRLLRGSRAVLGRGRAAQGAQLQKKKALTSGKAISAKIKPYAFIIRREKGKSND